MWDLAQIGYYDSCGSKSSSGHYETSLSDMVAFEVLSLLLPKG